MPPIIVPVAQTWGTRQHLRDRSPVHQRPVVRMATAARATNRAYVGAVRCGANAASGGWASAAGAWRPSVGNNGAITPPCDP